MTQHMSPVTVQADVGVIVARLQVHQLHEAHIDLINTVVKNHDKVFIFIGLSPLRNTSMNPLDFHTRKKMIQDIYPKIEVYYVEDNPSDIAWSKALDNQITKWIKPYQTVLLYGSRDSFLPHYSGRFPTQELQSTKYISGTEIRRRIANSYESTEAFRAGAIAASLNRYPTCYPTVDVAILDRKKKMVLVGKKSIDINVRFIGGFADPKSSSYEADALREVREETGLEVGNLQYVGSSLIDDWRYKKEQDKIKTMFFVADYLFGRPEAADDIASVEWISYDELVFSAKFIPEHKVLQAMLIAFLGLVHKPNIK